jgi:hypothetical protein
MTHIGQGRRWESHVVAALELLPVIPAQAGLQSAGFAENACPNYTKKVPRYPLP